MNMRTLLTTCLAAAVTCGVALGETEVKVGDPAVTIDVRVGPDAPDKAATGGWLGVRIMPIPAPLAAHLKTRGAGVMVGNLVEGSPAHKAGLKRYDVIVAMDGKAVEDGPALVKAVRGHKAGQKVALSVIQKGTKKTVAVVLSKPVPVGQAKLVHKDDEPAMWRDVLRVHPQIMLRKGAGNWEKMDDKNLPEHIRKMLKSLPKVDPGKGGPNIRMSAKTVIRRKDAEGRDIQIEQDQTGEITVTRKKVDADGKETDDVSKYKDADALQQMDTEAYEIYKKSGVRAFSRAGGKMFKLELPNVIIGGHGAIDYRKLHKDIRERILKDLGRMNLPDDVRKQIEEQLDQGLGDEDDRDEKDRTPEKQDERQDRKSGKNTPQDDKTRQPRKEASPV